MNMDIDTGNTTVSPGQSGRDPGGGLQPRGKLVSWSDILKKQTRTVTATATEAELDPLEATLNRARQLQTSGGEPDSLIFDFRGTGLSKMAALLLLDTTYKGKTGSFRPTSAGLVEVWFENKQALLTALENPPKLHGNQAIPVHCPLPKDVNLVALRLEGLPGFSSLDRMLATVRTSLSHLGEVKELKPQTFDGMDAFCGSLIALVSLPTPLTETVIPRSIPILDSEVTVSWRGAPPLCRYCKNVGHVLRDCPRKAQSDSRKRCFRCKENGHFVRECPQPPPTPSQEPDEMEIEAATNSLGMQDNSQGGITDGLTDGLTVGLTDGLTVGLMVGLTDGLTVGPTVGLTDGLTEHEDHVATEDIADKPSQNTSLLNLIMEGRSSRGRQENRMEFPQFQQPAGLRKSRSPNSQTMHHPKRVLRSSAEHQAPNPNLLS